MATFEVSIPENFNADYFIPKEVRSDRRANLRDGMYYFLNLLIPDALDKRAQEQLEQRGYITLHANTLRNIIGKAYATVIDLLCKGKVILVDKRYTVGKQSRGYRLTPAYTGKVKTVLITYKHICSRYEAFEKGREAIQKERLKGLKYLTKWLTQEVLNIDLQQAHNYVEGYYIKMKKKLEVTDFSSVKAKNEAILRMNNRVDYQRRLVKIINEGKYQPRRDSAGRLYTPVTALKKELRAFLTLKGEPVGSVDIKASQPYLFQLLLKEEFWNEKKKKFNLYNINTNLYNSITTLYSSIMLPLYEKNRTDRGFQDNGFENIIWENDFYTQLSNKVKQIRKYQNSPYFADRASTKEIIMILLYDNFEKKKPAYYKAFRQVFPKETRLMDDIKTGGSSLFPKILQSVEATIILEKICAELASDEPAMPMLTIHDSIATQEKHLEIVRAKMEDMLTEIVGKKPGLKIEMQTKEDAIKNLDDVVAEDWAKLLKEVTGAKTVPDWFEDNEPKPREIPILWQYPVIDGKQKIRTAYFDPNYEHIDESDRTDIEETWPEDAL